MIVSRKEFLRELSRRSGYSQIDLRRMIEVYGEVITEYVKDCKKVKLFDGLSVEGVKRKARNGHNPVTHEDMIVPEHISARVCMSETFKEKINS